MWAMWVASVLQFFEPTRLLVRFDHVASVIVQRASS